MKKFGIEAYSYNEAKEKALAMGISVVKNVTPSYKKERPVNFDDFCTKMLTKNRLTDAVNTGCMVVLESGSVDTRERPYEFQNNSVKGALTKKRIFEIRKKSNSDLVGEASHKKEAIKKAKEIMKEVREDLVCTQVYRVAAPHNVAFNLKYTPSAGAKLGKYVVFSN